MCENSTPTLNIGSKKNTATERRATDSDWKLVENKTMTRVHQIKKKRKRLAASKRGEAWRGDYVPPLPNHGTQTLAGFSAPTTMRIFWRNRVKAPATTYKEILDNEGTDRAATTTNPHDRKFQLLTTLLSARIRHTYSGLTTIINICRDVVNEATQARGET